MSAIAADLPHIGDWVINHALCAWLITVDFLVIRLNSGPGPPGSEEEGGQQLPEEVSKELQQ